MKLVNLKTNIKLKLAFLILLLVSFEVETISNKSKLEVEKLQKLSNLSREKIDKTKFDLNTYTNNIRFKSKLKGDSDENNDILVNSVVTESKKTAPTPEEGEIEVYASSATARSEFSWGFLFWSFMNFGASNALSGHSGYWLSERNSNHDYWDASFNIPQKIDVVEIHWRLPPKKMKIFYKLDQANDWIPATEIFSRDELKDKDGNKMPIGSSSLYNSVYFKKPLFCTEFRVMMNQPVKKKSFSITKVNFYQKISRGIIRTSIGAKKSCWYVNSDNPRDGLPIFVYPCLKTLMFATGNELFELTTSKLIKSLSSGFCVGYDENTKELLLRNCEDEGSAFTIQYNSDSSMYFDRLVETAIYMDQKDDFFNFIGPDTEITASSEADQNQYKKENMLLKGENYWASVPGQTDVTLQFIFGKIKCECNKNGHFEKRIIDVIRISWEREPTDFSVYTWNAGSSWKNIASFKGNTSKSTEISLIAETATGIMIRISNGNKIPDLGNMVSYAIKGVVVGFKGFKLKYGPYKEKSISSRLFEFELQNFITKSSTKEFDEAIQRVGLGFEKSVNAFKQVKGNFSSVDKVKKQGNEMCKKLNSFSSVVGEEAIANLNGFKKSSLSNFENSKFTEHIGKIGEAGAILSVVGKSLSSINASAQISFLETAFQTSLDEDENIPSIPSKVTSSGVSSKKKDEEEDVDTPKIGTKEAPGENCLHIRKLDPNSLSGFYYIKPECANKPFRVFCDFTLFRDAIDIYIFKDGSYLPNPDLSYLNINNDNDIKQQCGKYGLNPIELQNRDTVNRILQLLLAGGMDFTQDNYVPLGYDFSCRNNKCSGIYNSIISSNSLPIMNMFEKSTYPGEVPQNTGRFAGFGKTNESSMTTFDSLSVKISALICSSNKNSGEYSDNPAQNISCSMNISNNSDQFSEGKDIVVLCPKSCSANSSPVYGSGLYHGDSSICRSAIHQGVIGGDGGKVTVRVQNKGENYNGSLQNGVKSQNHDNDGLKAFIVIKYAPNCPFTKGQDSSFIQEKEFIQLKTLNESNLDNLSRNNMNLNLTNINLKSMDNSTKDNLIMTLLNQNNNAMRFAQVSNQNNNKIFGADSQAAANLGGLTANAAAAASDVMGMLNNTKNSLAAGLNGTGNLGLNALKQANDMANSVGNGFNNLFGQPELPKADPGSSKGVLSQPTSPADIAASLSLNAGLGGTYKLGLQDADKGSSISDPANNPNSNMKMPGPSPYDNIPFAFAKTQQWTDPNLASSLPASGALSNMNLASNPNNPTPEAYQVPDNLLGNASLKAGIDLGGSGLDLSAQGKPIVDPTTSAGDDDKGGLSINAGLTVAGGLAMGIKMQTSASAKEELKKMYDASVGHYLNNIKTKTEKISATVSSFSSSLNQAISSVGNASIQAGNISANASIGIDIKVDASASLNVGASLAIGGAASIGASIGGGISSMGDSVGGGMSAGKNIVGTVSGVAACSVATIGAQFQRMSELKGKISGLISKLEFRAKSRILKVEKLKERFTKKLASYSLQDSIKIDFNRYASIEIASKYIFGSLFSITKKKSVSVITNWGITSKNIKGRKRAIGVTISEKRNDRLAATFLVLNSKVYYDFKLKIDLLFLSKGVAGVAFRVQDQFNYYALVIDKNIGYKAIVKVVNGEMIILKKVNDGGILINDWHQVIITVTAGNINVYMYDKETASKAVSEKTIEIEDYTFVRGTVAIIINGLNGFYFDNFSIQAQRCWTPWQPKSSIVIKNTNSNIFFEDFRGTFIDRYLIMDIEEAYQRDGPSAWSMTFEDSILGSFIFQSSKVFDTSPKKRPTFILLKDKNFCNGIFKIHFQPEQTNAMISIIFKYNKEVNSTGNAKEEYYTFDMMNSNDPTFKFRRWSNGDIKILSSISVSQIKGLAKTYIAERNNIVEVEYVNDRVTIRISQDNSQFYDVINIVEDTIKCGNVGFGTSNTSAKFTGIFLEPLRIKLTAADIDLVLNKNFDVLPFPSVRRIKKIAERSQIIMNQMIKNSSAFGFILSQISILGSSMGFDLKSDKKESISSTSSSSSSSSSSEFSSSVSINQIINPASNNNAWKVCVMSRSSESRKKYCEQTYNNSVFQEKCEKNFCTDCCESRIDPIYGNLIHICKKTCFKSTISADSGPEYKNVCITSHDTRSNVYEYCDKKMGQFSSKSKDACKLDMCNLCCVTMDTMKKKNYSIENLKHCFKECSKEFNSGSILPNDLIPRQNLLPGAEQNCEDKKKENIDYDNIYNYENNVDMKKFKTELGVPLHPPNGKNPSGNKSELDKLKNQAQSKSNQ